MSAENQPTLTVLQPEQVLHRAAISVADGQTSLALALIQAELPNGFQGTIQSLESGLVAVLFQQKPAQTPEITLPENLRAAESRPQLSASEFAALAINPVQYIARELARTPQLNTPILMSWWEKGKLQKKDIAHLPTLVGLESKNSTLPTGTIESIGMHLLHLLENKIPAAKPDVVLRDDIGITQALLQRWNTKLEQSRQALQLPLLPHLPEFSETCISNLQQHWHNTEYRYQLLLTLTKLELDISHTEQLLRLLDTHGELQTPLAFRLLTTLLRFQPNSPFVIEQQKRYLFMLDELQSKPAQELFNQVLDGTLQQKLATIILPCNPLAIPPVKVGIEVEYQREVSADKFLQVPGFADGRDIAENREIRKNPHKLQLDPEYLWHLSCLQITLDQTATHLAGFHYHLDRQEHPNTPWMNHLFGLRNSRDWVWNGRRTPTWEVRAFFPPSRYTVGKNQLDPAGMLAAICCGIFDQGEMFINMQTLDLPPNKKFNLYTLFLGHLINQYQYNPELLLAALKVVLQKKMLKVIPAADIVPNYGSTAQQFYPRIQFESEWEKAAYWQELLSPSGSRQQPESFLPILSQLPYLSPSDQREVLSRIFNKHSLSFKEQAKVRQLILNDTLHPDALALCLQKVWLDFNLHVYPNWSTLKSKLTPEVAKRLFSNFANTRPSVCLRTDVAEAILTQLPKDFLCQNIAQIIQTVPQELHNRCMQEFRTHCTRKDSEYVFAQLRLLPHTVLKSIWKTVKRYSSDNNADQLITFIDQLYFKPIAPEFWEFIFRHGRKQTVRSLFNQLKRRNITTSMPRVMDLLQARCTDTRVAEQVDAGRWLTGKSDEHMEENIVRTFGGVQTLASLKAELKRQTKKDCVGTQGLHPEKYDLGYIAQLQKCIRSLQRKLARQAKSKTG